MLGYSPTVPQSTDGMAGGGGRCQCEFPHSLDQHNHPTAVIDRAGQVRIIDKWDY